VRVPLGGRDACVAQDLLDDALAAKIRNSVVLYRPLCEIDGVEIRLHKTILYASLCRADDDLLVNPHAYDVTASRACPPG
jgi:hypothetical protein